MDFVAWILELLNVVFKKEFALLDEEFKKLLVRLNEGFKKFLAFLNEVFKGLEKSQWLLLFVGLAWLVFLVSLFFFCCITLFVAMALTRPF